MTPFAIVTGDFVTTGGMDRANYALASFLARQGHPVHLIAYRASSDLLKLPNIRIHRVPKLLNSYFLSIPILDLVGRSRSATLSRQGARVVVNGGSAVFGDINWVHYIHAAFPTQGSGSVLQKWKLYAGGHLWRWQEKESLSRARVVIANSELTRKQLLTRFNLDPAQVHCVYYGIDPNLFRPAEAGESETIRQQLGWPLDRPQFAFIGAMGDQRKGFETVFEAWKILVNDSAGWDAQVNLIGTGSEVPLWQQRVSEAGLADHFRFLGFRSDVPILLRACNGLISPTRYEAYGLNVHEALCCGLPAFVSANAGVAERYPSELNELLLPDPTDAADLANRILTWRKEPGKLIESLGKLSTELRSYTWDDMAARILNMTLNVKA